MTALLITAVTFTLGVSAFCSLLEAMVLSTTTTDIESLKKRAPRRGQLLEIFRTEIEETSSAILSLNTIANTAGASISGALAIEVMGQANVLYFSSGLVLGILVFSEVIPKNIGVLYRPSLIPYFIYPLHAVRLSMRPFSWVARRLLRAITGERPVEETGDEEILLLAEKSTQVGTLTSEENALISNALSLDQVHISKLMTPRTVVTALQKDLTMSEVFETFENLSFARMPVYNENIDDIVGLIRRRDLLKAKANDQDQATVESLMQEIIFIPENATGEKALQQFLQSQQQLAVAVDEFGSMSGVITMEDIIEYILGQEIFEKDDPAVDMRELAKRKQVADAHKRRSRQGQAPAASAGSAAPRT
ncbi:MAG: CNNM domain-containing protein [Opitutales bacterium]